MALEKSLLCSDLSKSVNEPLFSTAPITETWLLLEYPFPYGAKAFEESGLSDQIKSHLAAVQKFLPNPRLVMIKKNTESVEKAIDFFLAFANERQQQLYHLELGSYDEILDVDFQSYLAASPTVQDKLDPQPMFLVCTNSKRDRCCAKFGLPLYEAISDYLPSSIWQSSHVGGHRFAGNLICLPHGVYYGRVPPDHGRQIIDAYRDRNIVLEYYRGRACYTPAQQAADYYLRTHTGIIGLDEIHLADTHELDENHWTFIFEDDLGKQYQIRIHRELSDFDIFESCNTPEKRSQQSIYELQDIHEI